jgi:hypothetical protein
MFSIMLVSIIDTGPGIYVHIHLLLELIITQFLLVGVSKQGPDCPGDDNFPKIFKGTTLWGLGPIFLQPFTSVRTR